MVSGKKIEEKCFHDSSHGHLIKIWSAAHKSSLTYNVSSSVSVGSYFHVSGVQRHGLKEAAASSGLSEPLHWPDFKGVHFADFLCN